MEPVTIFELIRMLVMFIIMGIVMFVGQPRLYSDEIIPLFSVDDPAGWADEAYMTGAIFVFAVSVALVIIWYGLGYFAQIEGSWDVPGKKLLWYFFLFLSVVSVSIGVWLSCYSESEAEEAIYSLSSIFFLDILVSYWFTTAISSPLSLKFTPLGSYFLRRFVSKFFGG